MTAAAKLRVGAMAVLVALSIGTSAVARGGEMGHDGSQWWVAQVATGCQFVAVLVAVTRRPARPRFDIVAAAVSGAACAALVPIASDASVLFIAGGAVVSVAVATALTFLERLRRESRS